jgi:hypothetical protein
MQMLITSESKILIFLTKFLLQCNLQNNLIFLRSQEASNAESGQHEILESQPQKNLTRIQYLEKQQSEFQTKYVFNNYEQLPLYS